MLHLLCHTWMSDPDLGLVDSGFLMKGKCFLLGQELGSTLVSVGPSGIKWMTK